MGRPNTSIYASYYLDRTSIFQLGQLRCECMYIVSVCSHLETKYSFYANIGVYLGP